MPKSLRLCAITLSIGLCLTATSLSATTLTLNSSLAEGVYFGTGNPNAGFAKLTDGSLELGLEAITRFLGPAPQDNAGNYLYTPGATTVPTKTGSSWGFVFSVDTNIDGNGLTTAEYTYLLSITDLSTSATVSFDPTLIPDNAHLGSRGFQNSEALSFGFLVPYDINARDTYQISLSATPTLGGQTDTVTIDVTTTPEPGSLLMLGTGLLGIGSFVRRKLGR